MTAPGYSTRQGWVSWAILAFLFLGGFRAVAAEHREESKTIALRVQGLPNPSAADPNSVAGRRVMEEFRRRFPQVELIAAEGLRIPNLVTESVTIMMVLGGIAPDVIRMNFRSIDSFVRQGIVDPLDNFLAAEADAGESILKGIPRQIMPVVTRPSPHEQGKTGIFGLPGDLMVVGLYYNREVFRRAGLPNRAPRDWEELAEFAKRVSEIGDDYYGLFLVAGADASWSLMNFLWSAGGEAVEEFGPNEWRAAFNSSEAVEAYMFYYRLLEQDRTALRVPRRISYGLEKTLGMKFDYVGSTVSTSGDEWGIGAVPIGPSGQRGSEINASIYGLYSGIRDPEVRRLAYEYIKFVTGSEAERIKVETFVELGEASAVSPLLLRKYGFDEYLALLPPGLEKEFLEAMQHGKPEPYGKNCTLIYAEMSDPLDRILLSPQIARTWKAGDLKTVRETIQRILNEAVARTNERMLNYVPPEEMRFRRVVAAIVAALSGLAFVVVIAYVFRAFSRSADMISRPVKGRTILPWIFLLPALALILMWSYIPVLRGTVIAFLDFNILLKSSFVGLDNFANALFDRDFWNSLRATLHYAAWILTLGFAAPIALAYILHLIPKHKMLFRTLYYLPSMISGTAVFFLWFQLFSADGIFNHLAGYFNLGAGRAWTEDPRFAMLTCVLPVFWAGTGPGCLIYLAALKTIPDEQFEAAEIDGAGFFQKTLQIVFPGLRTLILINFVGAVVAAFHSSGNILIMTGGGPNGMTEVTSLFIFFEAFTRLRLGAATAMAWILASMLVGFTIIQLKRLSRLEYKTVR